MCSHRIEPPPNPIRCFKPENYFRGHWFTDGDGGISEAMSLLQVGQSIQAKGPEEFRRFVFAKSKPMRNRLGFKTAMLMAHGTIHIWRTA